MGSEKSCVIVFVKAPETEKVKTRLAETVGAEAAMQLYRCFAGDVLEMLTAGNFNVRIFYYPEEAVGTVKRWLGKSYEYFEQKGEDLGQKMAGAFLETFSYGYERAVLIGTDLPDLPGSIISEALERLAKNCNVVIGPSTDGGYYLIGFNAKSLNPDVFTDISWGGSDVFHITLDRIRELGADYHILPRWRDIDLHDDLLCLAGDLLEGKRKYALNTRSYLKKLGYLPP